MGGINSMSNIFVNSEKMPWSGITNDSTALLCRRNFEPKTGMVLFILHFCQKKDKSSLAFSISIGLTFFINKIQNSWRYPPAGYDQYKYSKNSCSVLRDDPRIQPFWIHSHLPITEGKLA